MDTQGDLDRLSSKQLSGLEVSRGLFFVYVENVPAGGTVAVPENGSGCARLTLPRVHQSNWIGTHLMREERAMMGVTWSHRRVTLFTPKRVYRSGQEPVVLVVVDRCLSEAPFSISLHRDGEEMRMVQVELDGNGLASISLRDLPVGFYWAEGRGAGVSFSVLPPTSRFPAFTLQTWRHGPLLRWRTTLESEPSTDVQRVAVSVEPRGEGKPRTRLHACVDGRVDGFLGPGVTTPATVTIRFDTIDCSVLTFVLGDEGAQTSARSAAAGQADLDAVHIKELRRDEALIEFDRPIQDVVVSILHLRGEHVTHHRHERFAPGDELTVAVEAPLSQIFVGGFVDGIPWEASLLAAQLSPTLDLVAIPSESGERAVEVRQPLPPNAALSWMAWERSPASLANQNSSSMSAVTDLGRLLRATPDPRECRWPGRRATETEVISVADLELAERLVADQLVSDGAVRAALQAMRLTGKRLFQSLQPLAGMDETDFARRLAERSQQAFMPRIPMDKLAPELISAESAQAHQMCAVVLDGGRVNVISVGPVPPDAGGLCSPLRWDESDDEPEWAYAIAPISQVEAALAACYPGTTAWDTELFVGGPGCPCQFKRPPISEIEWDHPHHSQSLDHVIINVRDRAMVTAIENACDRITVRGLTSKTAVEFIRGDRVVDRWDLPQSIFQRLTQELRCFDGPVQWAGAVCQFTPDPSPGNPAAEFSLAIAGPGPEWRSWCTAPVDVAPLGHPPIESLSSAGPGVRHASLGGPGRRLRDELETMIRVVEPRNPAGPLALLVPPDAGPGLQVVVLHRGTWGELDFPRTPLSPPSL